MFSLSGETIFESGYGNQVKFASSGYEYAIVFFFVSFLYSRKGIINASVYLLLAALFIYKDIIYGGRISSLQMLLLLYILIFDNKIKFKYILISGIFLILLMKFWEVFRMSNDLLVTFDLLSESNNIKIYGSNEGEVVHASIRIVGFINEGFVNIFDRTVSFFYFLISIVNPGFTFSAALSDVPSYLKDDYPRGGGGLFPVYVFFWTGYVGVILSSFYLSKIFNSVTSDRTNFVVKKYLTIYCVMLLITFPRWFAYYPLNMFKISLLPVIIVFIISLFPNSVK